MSSSKGVENKILNNMNAKQLKIKASEFLSSKKYASNLLEIIQYFQVNIKHKFLQFNS